MNVICDFCGAYHWIQERTANSSISNPQFETCCKQGDVDLPLFNQPPPLILDLLQSNNRRGREFRQNIRQYNSALAFTSINCKTTDRNASGSGIQCFQIHGELYHMHGPLRPGPDQTPAYAQLYFYDPAYATEIRARRNRNLDPQLLRQLTDMLHEVNNPFIQLYKTAAERLADQQVPGSQLRVVLNPQMRLVLEAGVDRRRENLPTVEEVAVIIPDETGDPSGRDIILASRNGPQGVDGLRRVPTTTPAYVPMHYVLMFPRGDNGWGLSLQLRCGHKERKRTRLTQAMFSRFYLHPRRHSRVVPFAFHKLFQQYVVDAWAVCEQSKLAWVRNNQSTLRRDIYRGVADAIANAAVNGTEMGSRVVLPSNFVGSARHYNLCFQNSMAIVRWAGHPTLFITMTANPKWAEILRELGPNETAADRPDLVVRIFYLKIKELMRELESGIFGKYRGMVHSIEYQKRGLPHCHILLFLYPNDRDRMLSAAVVDRVISAELPLPEDDTDGSLTAVVEGMMTHGPCGADNPQATCMVTKQPGSPAVCSKKFPKDFREEMVVGENGYPQYRRRDNGRFIEKTCKGQKIKLDNRWVVPYNPYLSRKYGCHTNVEVCASVKAVKYIHKYIYKGTDRATFQLSSDNNDEVSQYLHGRYISPAEAIWRLNEFLTHAEYPPVVPLHLHLPDEQTVTWEEDATEEDIRKKLTDAGSTLTAFFKYNTDHSNGRDCLYQDFPTQFVYDKKKKAWHQRKKKGEIAIGRIYFCSPRDTERYYMRLLLTVVPGATSFEFLRTVAGFEHPTFQAACIALGLLQDDSCWVQCFEEARVFASGTKLRDMFVLALMYGPVTDPGALWEQFRDDICDDLEHALRRLGFTDEITPSVYHSYGIFLLERQLNDHGSTVRNFPGLPAPEMNRWSALTSNGLLAAELGYDPMEQDGLEFEQVQKLNDGQYEAFNTITSKIRDDPQNAHFFLQGPAGTGKTFLYQCLCYHYRAQSKVVICVASSGIAALLLPGGRTAHSRFKIPINADETTVCKMTKTDQLGSLMRQTALIIWDEVPMQNKRDFEAVDRTLRDVCSDESMFGGIPTVFGGDFAQILPVVKGGRADTVAACLQRSFLWDGLDVLTLRENMRVRNDPANAEFINWVRKLSTDESMVGNIKLLDDIAQYRSTDSFLDHVYPAEMLRNAHLNLDTFRTRAILSVRNVTVAEINEAILDKLEGNVMEFLSGDTAEVPQDGIETPPPELLQSFNPSSLPPSRLKLKIGAPVILIRNLYPKHGLCNGTRMVVTKMRKHCIEVRLLGGEFHGQTHLIPKIKTSSTEGELPYVVTRFQLPVRLCFAMTINKSQGQSFETVGVDLRLPVFTHGQLYVALSRVTSVTRLSVLLEDNKQPGTLNCIFPEVLLR